MNHSKMHLVASPFGVQIDPKITLRVVLDHSLSIAGRAILISIALSALTPLAFAQSSQQLRTTCIGVEPLPGKSPKENCCHRNQQAQCIPWSQIFQPPKGQPLPQMAQPQPIEKPLRLSNPQDVNTIFGVGTPDALFQHNPNAEHNSVLEETKQMAIKSGLGVILPPMERFAARESPGLTKLVRDVYAGYQFVLGPRKISPSVTLKPNLQLQTDAFRIGAEVKISD